jgi:poly(A) polymerase
MTDPAAGRVLDALEAAGGPDVARFVGGCVRNTLVGQPVADVDIATTLTPEKVIAALEAAGVRAVPTGVEHGTVTAVADHRPFEVTTLRRDVETDGRRAVVAFSDDWAEDASRRDFRLNALYADREGRLWDYVGGGVEDALEGRVVFVGDPEMRIREDYLRVLRFFRFYAWYGKGPPDAAGLAACAALKDGLARLSAERVSKELLRLLEAPDPRSALRLMHETGVLDALFPFPLDLVRCESMAAVDPDPELRLSALLPDDPALNAMAAERLRLSNAQRERLLAALPEVRLDLDAKGGRAAIYQAGGPAFCDRVKRAWAADPAGAGQARALLELAAAWTPPRFPLGGADVMAAGVTKGPEVGRLLRDVEAWWIAHDFPASGARERLAELVRGDAG